MEKKPTISLAVLYFKGNCSSGAEWSCTYRSRQTPFKPGAHASAHL